MTDVKIDRRQDRESYQYIVISDDDFGNDDDFDNDFDNNDDFDGNEMTTIIK